jgi:chitodextrinase
MSVSTASPRAILARLRWRAASAVATQRIARKALAVLAGTVTLALGPVSGTAAFWTGSVNLQPGTITAGSVSAGVAAGSRLDHTYSSSALSQTTYLTLSNSGTSAADYSLAFSSTGSAAMADQVILSHWFAANTGDCQPQAVVPAGGWTGPLGSAAAATGTFAGNSTKVLCVRTRLNAAALPTTATITPKVQLTLTVPGTLWSSTASATGTQSVVANTASTNDYTDTVLADGATNYWRLGEASGSVFYDWAGTNDAHAAAGITRGTSGAIKLGSDPATTFSGDSTGTAGTRVVGAAPNRFALEAWFSTTTTTGGKIIGFGNASTGTSGSYDRHIFMDATGRIQFGVYPGGSRTLVSSASYNDGRWHHVVGNLGPNGQELFVDGVRIGSDPNTTAAHVYAGSGGYWRIGGDSPWAGDAWFDGAIDEVAVYGAPLSASRVANHHNISGQGAYPAGAGDPSAVVVQDDAPSLYWRLGEAVDATIAADSSGAGNTGVYSGNVTKPVAGALPGTRNTAASFNGTDGLVASSALVTNPQVFTLELWFNTTSTTGGKLIGFGDAQTGLSTSYDRHLYLQNDGKVVFGVYNAAAHTAVSPRSYNDGTWHHVMATLDAELGMRLYVDGEIVAFNTDTQIAQAYNGYWRVGGDSLTGWAGAPTTPYVTATIDDVAVYGTALTELQVKERWAIATGDPIASFTSTANQTTVSYDGSASYDLDGSIVSYAWDFGDGTKGTGPTATHTYANSYIYIVTLTVTDDSGATSVSKWYQIATDSIAPTAPASITASNVTTNSVTLSWPASTDNLGVQGYQVLRSDGATFNTTGTTYTNTGLTSGTTYTYQVRARDQVNWSAYSPITSATTLNPTFSTATWYAVQNVANSKCVQASGTAAGSSLVQAACATNTAQHFRLLADGAYWRIEYRNAAGQVWDVSGASPTAGAKVILYTSAGTSTHQQWQVVQHGSSYSFKAVHSNMCLQFTGGAAAADGAPLEQATCDNTSAQRFTLAVAQ